MDTTDIDDRTDIPTHVPDRNGILSMAVFGLAVALLLIFAVAIAMAA